MRSILTIQQFLCVLGLSLCYFTAIGQNNCEGAKQSQLLYGNRVQTYMDASGSPMWRWRPERNNYYVTLNDTVAPYITTIFAHALWLSALDADGNLKVSAPTYGKAMNNEYDYYPGPITDQSNSIVHCKNWDKVWSVYRYEIEAHIADWQDNNNIDYPFTTIMAWPGRGNPHFETENGFELPDNLPDLAPFKDIDGDGIYNPMNGDYPIVEQSNVIPEQITWVVFNDQGVHTETEGEPLNVEIQQTSWALNCTENTFLNQSIFSSYKIINKGSSVLDSMYVGLWTDFDLGCFVDDYFGCAPEQNTYFAYNVDFEDNILCHDNIPSYGFNPPVQSITILNQPMDYFIMLSIGFFFNPPFGIPNTPQEYRNALMGVYRSGDPITQGGLGYQTSDTIVNHIFPGNPNNLEEWSMLSEGLPSADRRVVGSNFLGKLDIGEAYTLDVAYSTHWRADGNAHTNVNTMYEEVATLQSYYDNNFEESCLPPTFCEDKCVWPGDLNNDGIANHCDLINLVFAIDSTGNTRSGPYTWAPQNGQNWDFNQLTGINGKHLDANGDGIVSLDDFSLTQTHYNFTRPDYMADDVYNEGDDIILRDPFLQNFDNIAPGNQILTYIGLINEVPDLKVVSLSIEYDTSFFVGYYCEEDCIEFSLENSVFISANNQIGQLDITQFVLDDQEEIDQTFTEGIVRLYARDTFYEPLPSNQTQLRFKNIKAYLKDGTYIQLGGQTVTAVFPGIAVSTNDLSNPDEINIFPNPTTDQVRIESTQSRIENIQVFDATGQLVLSHLAIAKHQETIDLSAYANGIYFIQIRTDKGITTKKVIKQ